jgi:hypothetical protein
VTYLHNMLLVLAVVVLRLRAVGWPLDLDGERVHAACHPTVEDMRQPVPHVEARVPLVLHLVDDTRQVLLPLVQHVQLPTKVYCRVGQVQSTRCTCYGVHLVVAEKVEQVLRSHNKQQQYRTN